MESVFQDDDLLLHDSPAGVDATMAELRVLGVDRVRLSAIWRDIADPTDGPAAYPPDRIAQARPRDQRRLDGLTVLLNIRGGAPDWAQRPSARSAARTDAYKPAPARRSGAATRQFAGRPATRASTPGRSGTSPTGAGCCSRSRRGKPYAPAPLPPPLPRRQRRRCADGPRRRHHPARRDRAARRRRAAAPRAAQGRALLPRALLPRRASSPQAPLRRLRQARPAAGHRRRPPPVPGARAAGVPLARPGRIRLADGNRLARILDAARRYRRVPGRLPIWYTEFGYQTKPPDPYRGVSLKRQAAWNIRAERLAYRQKRVLALQPVPAARRGAADAVPGSDRRYWSTYQTGLRFADGAASRPTTPTGCRSCALSAQPLWGLVRPARNGAPQEITIERRRGGAWGPVGTRPSPTRAATSVRLASRGGEYRFVWHGLASPRPPVKRDRVTRAMDFKQLRAARSRRGRRASCS